LAKDLEVKLLEVKPESKKTKAPPSLTDSSLLTALETAGKTLDDKELAAVMKHSGLGTPATRSGIIETLLNRGYIERKGKLLISTPLGRRLIETVHLSVKSPELTARWEKALSQIQEGKQRLDEFMKALEADLNLRVQEVFNTVTLKKTRPTFQSQSLSPEKREKIAIVILKTLERSGSRPAGRLFEESAKELTQLQRNEYEQVLHSLKERDQIQVSEEKFQKGNESISYRKVTLKKRSESHPSTG
jgi:DNA topoisomerase-3